jgi:hypothetical protein
MKVKMMILTDVDISRRISMANTMILIYVLLIGSITEYKSIQGNTSIVPCRAEDTSNRELINSFLTDDVFATDRNQTGTSNITTQGVSIVQYSSQGFSACQVLTSRYSEYINDFSLHGNERKYNVTFYQAGSRYFVTITPRQPSDQSVKHVGMSFIIIFDQYYNRLAGFSS